MARRIVAWDGTSGRVVKFDDTGYAELKLPTGNGLKFLDGAEAVTLFQLDDDGGGQIGADGHEFRLVGYLELADQSTEPGVASSGEARLAISSGKLALSENGGAYADIVPDESSDGSVFLSANEAVPSSASTFTTAYNASFHCITLARAKSSSTHTIAIPLDVLAVRSTSSLGKRITSFDLIYAISNTDLDDVSVVVYRVIPPTDGSSISSSSVSFAYDAAHDTAAERGDATGDPEYHTLTGTFSGGGVWLNSNEGLLFLVTVDGDAGASALFTHFGLVVYYDHNERV